MSHYRNFGRSPSRCDTKENRSWHSIRNLFQLDQLVILFGKTGYPVSGVAQLYGVSGIESKIGRHDNSLSHVRFLWKLNERNRLGNWQIPVANVIAHDGMNGMWCSTFWPMKCGCTDVHFHRSNHAMKWTGKFSIRKPFIQQPTYEFNYRSCWKEVRVVVLGTPYPAHLCIMGVHIGQVRSGQVRSPRVDLWDWPLRLTFQHDLMTFQVDLMTFQHDLMTFQHDLEVDRQAYDTLNIWTMKHMH